MSNIIKERMCARVCMCVSGCATGVQFCEVGDLQVSLGEPTWVTLGEGACVCEQQWSGCVCEEGSVCTA